MRHEEEHQRRLRPTSLRHLLNACDTILHLRCDTSSLLGHDVPAPDASLTDTPWKSFRDTSGSLVTIRAISWGVMIPIIPHFYCVCYLS